MKAEEAQVQLATPRIGQTVDYTGIDAFNEHWWEAYE